MSISALLERCPRPARGLRSMRPPRAAGSGSSAWKSESESTGGIAVGVVRPSTSPSRDLASRCPAGATDETYLRVNGRWCYPPGRQAIAGQSAGRLWRAVDRHGRLIDLRLTIAGSRHATAKRGARRTPPRRSYVRRARPSGSIGPSRSFQIKRVATAKSSASGTHDAAPMTRSGTSRASTRTIGPRAAARSGSSAAYSRTGNGPRDGPQS